MSHVSNVSNETTVTNAANESSNESCVIQAALERSNQSGGQGPVVIINKLNDVLSEKEHDAVVQKYKRFITDEESAEHYRGVIQEELQYEYDRKKRVKLAELAKQEEAAEKAAQTKATLRLIRERDIWLQDLIDKIGHNMCHTKKMTRGQQWFDILRDAHQAFESCRERVDKLNRFRSEKSYLVCTSSLESARDDVIEAKKINQELQALHKLRTIHNNAAGGIIRNAQKNIAMQSEDPSEFCVRCSLWHEECPDICPCKHVERIIPDAHGDVCCMVCIRTNNPPVDDVDNQTKHDAIRVQHVLAKEAAAKQGIVYKQPVQIHQSREINNEFELYDLLVSQPVNISNQTGKAIFTTQTREFVKQWYSNLQWKPQPAPIEMISGQVIIQSPLIAIQDFNQLMTDIRNQKVAKAEKIRAISHWMKEHLYGSKEAYTMLKAYKDSHYFTEADRKDFQVCIKLFKEHWSSVQKGSIGHVKDNMYAVDRCQKRNLCSSTITKLCSCR